MTQKFQSFSREKHVFSRDEYIDELLKDIVRFFNGTPVQPLPPVEQFIGAGVYAIYYTGTSPLYTEISQANRLSYSVPIYVGKAVPSGWRQARTFQSSEGTELYKRLQDHTKSIKAANSSLNLSDFASRFCIFEGSSVGMIACVEAKMIETYKPVWNSCIDGFGNHDPGSGRYQQALSEWDSIHKGRKWTLKIKGERPDPDQVFNKVRDYLGAFKN